jgi:hypothetical protein
MLKFTDVLGLGGGGAEPYRVLQLLERLVRHRVTTLQRVPLRRVAEPESLWYSSSNRADTR